MKSDKTGTKMNAGPSFPIVGIGASAGGLDALRRFLAALPQDFDFALVFIQHLSSKHKSLLHELLSVRRPSLVIQQISDGLRIQPGRLYLAPPGREVRLRNGLFQTTVHPEGLVHLPIDEFLSSLAEDAGGRSIAVIFSGAGSDGARGCQTVRSASGTVFVQAPQTAEFDSMPLAAIATGQADAVLSPEEIAAEILKFQGLGEAALSHEYPITPNEFEDFFRLLQEKSGLRFNHYKKSVVGRRITRRMSLQGLSVVKDYLDLLSTNDTEAAHLASDFMIGVTSFFRDRVAWKALNREVVRKVAADNSDLPLRVWTPASATGEEAYSIAILLLRELEIAGKKRAVHVFATDLNDRALERAREGKYPASIVADVPTQYVQKYFMPVDEGISLVINKDVRECVVFARQDLLTDPPFPKLDLIICRNFLIYLEPEAQEKSISLFHYALKEGGFLFLGNAETVGRKSRLFQAIGHKQCRIYRKLETKSASRLPISAPYAAERPVIAPTGQARLSERKQTYTELIQERLLQEYAPATLAVDQNYEIIYHNGPTNRYLSQPRGVPTQNLLELLPQDLRNRIRGAIYRSGREEKPVAIRTNMAGEDKRKRQISLRITKIAENLHIVVFQEKGSRSQQDAVEQVDAATIEETAIHQLESELSATRVDLQSHIEQLKSLNEELQSSNEELQAANEELETSREELQSLNEELIIVNAQLQEKIEEQDATNNDLNNFLASTNIPTIFLDTQLRVKRFTPAMLKLIKLIPSDLGRPLIDMSRENLGPDLISDAQSVLESLVPTRRELELGAAWYVRAALPYRTADNRIEGVVITYNDVTELKRAEERTRHLASFPQLNPNPVIEVDASGNIMFVNPGTENILESLGMEGEVEAFFPKDLDVILKDLERNSDTSVNREVTVKGRVFSENIQLVPQFNVARIYAYEITQRKRAEEELRKSGELFRLAMDNMPDAISIYDAERRYQFINAAGLRRIGKPLESLVGRRIDEVYEEETRSAFWPALMRTYEMGTPQTIETRLKMPTGLYDLIMTFVPMLKDGQVHRVLNFTFDITERKRAEDAVQTSEQLLKLFIDHAPASLAMFDREMRYLSVSRRWMSDYGLGERDLRGLSHYDLFPEIPERWKAIHRRALAGEVVRDDNDRFDRLDGSVQWLRWEVLPWHDAAGDVGGILVFSEDITERKKAEEAQGRLAAIVESAEDAIIGEDLNGIIQTWNVGAENVFGYRAEEVIGKPISLLVPPGHTDEVPEILARIKRGEHIENFETERMRKDGTIVPVSLKFSAIKDASGRVIGASKIAHDVTERKRAQEERETTVAFLRLVNECRETSDLVRAAAEFFQQRSGCEAVGIRLHDKQDYPYFETRGFSNEFVQLESRLCSCDREGNPVLDSAGTPVLACMCGNVICGRFDPSKPFFTKRGSFWTNSTTELLATTTEVDRQARTRNRCNGEGYESVSLIGLTLGDERLGLLQLNDKRKGRFTLETITLWERLADYLAVALAKFRSDEALRESEERYRNLFNTMDEGFCIIKMIFDAEGRPVDYRFLEVNAAFEKQTGLHDATGKLMRDLAPAHEAHWFEIYGKIALTGVPLRFVNEARALDRWYDVYAYRVGRPEDQQVAILFNDISGHKKAEEALHKSSRTLKALSNSSKAVIRAEDETSFMNDVCAIIVEDCGFSMVWIGFAENDEAKSVRPVAHAGLEEGYLETLQITWDDTERGRGPTGRAIRTGKVAVCRNMLTDPAFTLWREEALRRGYASSIVFPFWADDKVFGAITIYSKEADPFSEEEVKLLAELADDLAYGIMTLRMRAAHKAAETALRSSEARYRNLFETMSEGFSIDEIILDDTGTPVDLRYLEVNPAFERHTGLKAADIVGRTTLELFPTAERAWFERYGKVALTGEPAHFEEWFGPLGRYYEVSVYRTEPNRFAVVFIDITERKKAEADIMKLSENMAARNLELESVNKELDAFNYSVSHDLRAPLRTVSGFSKIIYEDYADKLDEQGRDYLSRIKNGSDRMTHLIDDLLRLSHISRQNVERMDYDLSTLAFAVVNSLPETAPARNTEVVIAEGLRAVVDPNLMKIALTNLFDNAWKFTSKTENARIEFGVTEKDAKIVYFVKDNGAGFDPDYAERMFRPFQRLHSEKEFEGTGIGLAIVERIIRRHDGRVWAEGEAGKGATIYFTLG